MTDNRDPETGFLEALGQRVRTMRALRGMSEQYRATWKGITHESRIRPLRDRDGTIVGILGVGIDVTEQTRMEEHLRESEERFRAVVDASACRKGRPTAVAGGAVPSSAASVGTTSCCVTGLFDTLCLIKGDPWKRSGTWVS